MNVESKLRARLRSWFESGVVDGICRKSQSGWLGIGSQTECWCELWMRLCLVYLTAFSQLHMPFIIHWGSGCYDEVGRMWKEATVFCFVALIELVFLRDWRKSQNCTVRIHILQTEHRTLDSFQPSCGGWRLCLRCAHRPRNCAALEAVPLSLCPPQIPHELPLEWKLIRPNWSYSAGLFYICCVTADWVLLGQYCPSICCISVTDTIWEGALLMEVKRVNKKGRQKTSEMKTAVDLCL